MSIFDKVISVVAPYICLGCQAEGSLLCRDCKSRLGPVPSTCQVSIPAAALRNLYTGYAYTGISKELVGQLKFNGAQAAAKEMATLLAKAYLFPADEHPILVPIPTASTRVRMRGYDQAKLLAKALSRQLDLEYNDCLLRSGQSRQVGASRSARKQQLANAYNVRWQDCLVGKTILLLDDVMTTGATLEAAAAAIHNIGAAHIDGLVFAHA